MFNKLLHIIRYCLSTGSGIKIHCLKSLNFYHIQHKKMEIYKTPVDIKTLIQTSSIQIYDKKNKLGQYYARDFLTIEEYRDKKIEQILGL